MEWSLAGAAMQRQSGNNHAEVAEVIAEMNCILDDPRFSSSSRCAKLLRFLVENALAEDSQLIKERTLGIKVFGRSPDYDTNADPVVRMAATEVRKRLAAHYQGSQHGGSVAIRLNPGGYLLTFEPRREEVKPAATTFDPVVDSPEDTSPGAHREAHSSVPGPALPSDIAVNSRRLLGFWRVWWIALLLALVMTGITFTTVSVWNRGYLSTLSSDFPRYAFWKPLLQSPEPIFLCVSDERLLSSGETSASFEELVGFVDVNSAHKITLALRGFTLFFWISQTRKSFFQNKHQCST